MADLTPNPISPVHGVVQLGSGAVWPVCGHCGKLQQAVCGSCSHAGSDFRLIEPELQDGESPCWQGNLNGSEVPSADAIRDEHTLFECPICEDIHTLGWYRHCYACGESFPNAQTSRPARRLPFADELTPRVLSVFVGLVLITAAVLTLLGSV